MLTIVTFSFVCQAGGFRIILECFEARSQAEIDPFPAVEGGGCASLVEDHPLAGCGHGAANPGQRMGV